MNEGDKIYVVDEVKLKVEAVTINRVTPKRLYVNGNQRYLFGIKGSWETGHYIDRRTKQGGEVPYHKTARAAVEEFLAKTEKMRLNYENRLASAKEDLEWAEGYLEGARAAEEVG